MHLRKLRMVIAATAAFALIGTCTITASAHGNHHSSKRTYHECEYEDCELTYKHSHDDGCYYYGHYEGDGHCHSFDGQTKRARRGHCH